MRPRRDAARAVPLVAVLLLGVGCGLVGDDGGSSATTLAPSTSLVDIEPLGDPSCDDDTFTGQARRQPDEANGHPRHRFTDGAVSTAAVGIPAPDQYTVWLADAPIDEEVIATYGTLTADPERALVTITMSDDVDVEIGEPVPAEDFTVLYDSGGGQGGVSAEPSGSLTVTGLDDDRICLDIDYTSDVVVLRGSIGAGLVRSDSVQ